MPKISVVIPTHNRAKYICEAIDSALSQTYKDFEIIVVDDGSTDNTKSVLIKYGDRIRYFHQQAKGQSAARNFGIREAKGEYVAFLDSDDVWLPSKLETYLNYFNSNTKIPFICAKMGVINEKGKKITGKLKPEHEPGTDFRTIIEKGSCSTSTFMVKRDILDSIRFDEDLAKLTDLDFCLKIAKQHKILVIKEILTLYREHALNSCANKVISYKHQVKFWEMMLYGERNVADVFFYKNKLAKLDYILAKEYFINKNYEQGFKCIYASLNYNLLAGKLFWQSGDRLISKILKILKPYGLATTCLFLRGRERGGVKKVLIYESSSGFGGSANALVNLLKFLDKNTFAPVVVFRNNGAQIDRIKEVETIKLKNYKEPGDLSNLGFLFYFARHIFPWALHLFFLIKSKKINLVHVNNNIIAGIPVIIAAKLAGKSCICHIRQTRKLIKRERFFSKWVNKFIVLNEDAYQMLKQDIPEEKLNLIYDGIDLEDFSYLKSGNFRIEFNLDATPVIGLIGRVVKGKGHKEFILAAKEVLKSKPNIKFLIIGDSKGENDDYFKEAKKLVGMENLYKNVIFTGWRTDISIVISNLNILVHAATSPEGLPNVIIEAMAFKKPIIATNVPGSSEIVIDGETGFLIPPGNIKAMAEKIIYLLDNPDISKKMGELGRKSVKEKFDIIKTVERVEGVYREVAA